MDKQKELIRTLAKLALLSLFCICTLGSMAQSKRLDTIENKIRQHLQRDTTRVRLILDYSRNALNDNTTKLLPYLNEVISISKEKHFRRGLQSGYVQLQAFYSDRGNVEKANAYADTAFTYLKKDNSKFAMTSLAWLYNNVAGDYAKLADYQQAIHYLTKAARVFEQHEPTALAGTYGNIAMMYAYLLLPGKAMEYDRKAIAAAEKSRDTLAIVRRNLGYTARLLDQEKFGEADLILNKIKPLVLKADNNSTYVFYYQNKGLVSKNRKQYRQAVMYLKKAYDYTVENDDKLNQAILLDPLTAVLTESGSLDEAKNYLDILLAKSLAYKIRTGQLNAYKNFAQWYRQKKDYQTANDFLIKSIKLSDSLSSEEMKETIAAMETRFRVEGKNTEIKKLQAEKNIQNLQLIQKSTLNYVLFGSAIALAIILILFYRNYSHRQKLQQQRISELETEKQLTATEAVLKGEEQERSRLAKDLHDGLGGMLSGIKYSLNTMKGNLIMTPENAQAFERSIDMLDSSIHEMRRVAHNMMPEVLVNFGLDAALRDYCSEIDQSGALKVNYQSIDLKDELITQIMAITIYRIIQELINNTIKHAQATQCIVQVSNTGRQLSITVEDNGRGFDKNILYTSNGMGWENIRHRVAFLKGRIDIHTSGKGTSVLVELDT